MTLAYRRAWAFGFTGQNTSSGTLVRTPLTSASFSMGYGDIGSQYDWREWNVPVEAGTYALHIVHRKTPASGIVTVSIDGVDLGTPGSGGVDWYGTSATANNRVIWSGITVGATGVIAVRLRVDSKNGSSSSYAAEVQAWELVRTGVTTASGDLDFDAKHIDIMPWGAGSDALTGGAFDVFTASAGALSGGYNQNPPASAANGQTKSWYVPLAAGTWTLTALYIKNFDAGIFAVTLGGATVTTGWDHYVNGTTFNVSTNWTGITVADDGVYELRFTTNGKNALSADYALYLQWLTFVKTA